MKLLLTTTLLFFFSFSFAQYSVSGYLFDETNEPLSFASVVLVKASDSTVVGFGLSNNKGKYLMDVEDSGSYLLQYSFLGYATQYKPLETNWQTKDIILKNVTLKPSQVNLDEVSIEADRIPMKMNGDTIQYDAKAFKVAEGSDVEKLLSKMPGIEIDQDGNVTAHGKKVEKILVDGKEFFGNDPKMATKNLEAKAIDKVEVLDKKSKDAEFSGVDDGEEQKTINLTLKEEFKNGSFGRAKAGIGTEETYKGKVNYNRFNKNTQISAIANANNINEVPFTYKEFQEFAPGNDWNSNLIQGVGSDEGINRTVSLGLNANHEFSKKFELQGFYYLTQNNNELDKATNTKNFNDDTLYLRTTQDIEKEEAKLNHSFNIKMEWKPDSMTEIDLWSNVYIATENYNNISSTLYDPTVELTNFTENRSNSEIDKLSTYNSINYKRKFNKEKRNIRLFANHYGIKQDDNTVIDNQIFGQDINQNQVYNNQFSRPRFGISYTEPLDSFWVVITSYNFRGENEKPNRNFFDLENNGLETFNDSLSSVFERVSNENSGSVTFQRSKNKKYFTIGTSANTIDLSVNDNVQTFQYLLPFVSVRFRLKGSQNLNFGYYTRTNIPSLEQLVSIPDNLNPNSIYVGNPNLRPEYSQTINFNYFNFDPASSTNTYAGLSMSSTSNKIVNQTIIKEDFTTLRTPQNSGFSQNINLYAGINKPLKKLKIKLGLYPNINLSRYDVFLNTLESEVFSANYSARINVERLKKEKWNLSVGFNVGYNDRKYEANASFNQAIGSYGAFMNGDFEITKSLQFKWDYDLRAFNATTFADARELHLINLSIRQSFKEDDWAVSLIANDILNENVGIQRNGDVNTLFSSNYNTRAKYFMILLEKSLGKKVTNPNKKSRKNYYYSD